MKIIKLALGLSALILNLSSCYGYHPLLQPDVRNGLHTTTPFDHEKLITKDTVKLDDVPLKPKEEIFERAKAVTTPTSSLPVVELSLDDVRKYTLENNLGLMVQVYSPSIDEQKYMVEKAKFEAVLSASPTFSESNDYLGEPLRTYTAAPSIKVPNQLGGTTTLGLSYTKTHSHQVDTYTSIVPDDSVTTAITLSASQPLLRSAGLKANHASIEMAGLRARQSSARTKLSAIRILATAEQTYWRYYAAYENLKIQIKKYELAKEQLRMARRMVEEGIRTNVEVTRAKSGLAREFEAIIRAETQRRRMERSFKRTINLPDLSMESETIIRPITAPAPVGFVFQRSKVTELAFQNRMDLFENELQQAIDKIMVDLNDNLTLPGLQFIFSYSFSNTQPEFNKALDHILKDEYDSYSVGLSADIPIGGNRAAKARLRQYVLSQKQTLARQKDLELAVNQEVLDAIDGLEQDWQRILANRIAVALANEAYEAEKVQFQHGTITSTELLQALITLSNAKVSEIQSMTDYQNSLVDLAYATGTVLGRGGVMWTLDGLNN